MPPGTGDAQLSLVQATQVHGAIIVTTPQDVAVGDALRGVKMFERVDVPVLGIVENMSWFECPHCGKPTPIFGTGGGERLANELGAAAARSDPAVSARAWRAATRGADRRRRPESSAARALTVDRRPRRGARWSSGPRRARLPACVRADAVSGGRLPLETHEEWRPSRSRAIGEASASRRRFAAAHDRRASRSPRSRRRC